MIELAADLLVAFLLVLTTSWCVLLYRRLDRLRVERSDIETFLGAVDGAVRRAEQAVAGIRDGAAEAQRLLAAEQDQAQQRVGRARAAGRQRRPDGASGRDAPSTRVPGPWPRTACERERSAARSLARPTVAGSRLPATAGMARERPAGPRIDAELLKALEALR